MSRTTMFIVRTVYIKYTQRIARFIRLCAKLRNNMHYKLCFSVHTKCTVTYIYRNKEKIIKKV